MSKVIPTTFNVTKFLQRMTGLPCVYESVRTTLNAMINNLELQRMRYAIMTKVAGTGQNIPAVYICMDGEKSIVIPLWTDEIGRCDGRRWKP